MNITLDPEAHLYLVEGEPFPSVTHVIGEVVPYDSAPFRNWCRCQGIDPDEYRNHRAKLGTLVHSALEQIAKGQTPDPFDYPECEGFLSAIDRFVTENDPDFHDAESKTASLEHRYAGTLDAFVTFRSGKHKGASARLDMKTGKVQKEKAWPQIEAYEYAEVEQGKPASDLRLVLDVKATGKYRLVKSTDTFNDFWVLLEHYRSVENRRTRGRKK